MRTQPVSWLFLVFLLLISSATNTALVSGLCLDDQSSLLLQLRDSLSFNSTQSTRLKKWNKDEDCCEWEGVACDSSGHVIRLGLDNETISGGIENSSSLFSLHNLEYLNLAFNEFNYIQIPPGLSNLTNLVYLNLSNAGFGGQIPIELSTVRRLQILDLSTLFPGTKPLKLENPNFRKFVENLRELTNLYLDGVTISAHGNEWCQALSSNLPNLRELSMRNCNISGPLDSSLSKLPHLSVIRLEQNVLSTEVPEFFSDFSNLTTLIMSSCGLKGVFPESIFQVSTLQNLDISSNFNLAGVLPQHLQSSSLRTLVLSYTKFSGPLPDSIGNLTALSWIELSNCSFRGSIPYAMTRLKELVHLDFSFNNFTGSLPSFQMSKNLKHLDLSRNSLTGPIPSSHFEGLSDLVYINLGYNLLNGSIPQSLFQLQSLQKLHLPNNKFEGPVKVIDFNASASLLDTLDLSGNQLNGVIPNAFFELQRLKVLALSSNSFHGTVKLDTINRLHNLTRLELSYNKLSIETNSSNPTSAFPQISVLKLASCNLQRFPELRNLTRMMHLDLSDNQIEGEIPNWIWKVGILSHLNLSRNLLVKLQEPYQMPDTLNVLDLHSNQLQGVIPKPPSLSAIYVDYSNNNFTGVIPNDIGNFISFVSFFSLSNNRLTGGVPESLCNATYLLVLDLSANDLSGTVPSCLLQEIATLGVLNLGKNRLTNVIPDKFVSNCGLKTLDLSRNNFTGQVPKSLVNCASLEVLNIGNNNVDDTFPCMLKNLSSLRVLVLRSNRFHGDIRCRGPNNSWTNLQIMDIAGNKFSGTVSSKCFSNWKGMMNVDGDAESGSDHLRYDFLNLSNLYYQDAVTVTIKGLEMELVKILKVFTSIDLSRNDFQGVIPDEVGELKALYILNLSHNQLTGSIPRSIGNLRKLGSLDLSENNLSGEIPVELASLTFLAFLNLSFNKLIGKIPISTQLQSFSAASFEGNPGLCGFPLKTTCNATEPSSSPPPTALDASAFDWQFIFIGVGFGMGAAFIIAPLVFCKKGRNWCNEHLDKILKLIFPMYGFTYTRFYDGNIEAEVDKGESSGNSDFDEDEDVSEDQASRCKYCVFCSKLDFHIKQVVHNSKCTCHSLPPNFSSSTSSSSSLLFVYHQNR